VWSVIGALSQATEHLVIGRGVTCPTVRIHPAIVAQAAATAAALLPGRFMLGVGSGENLNEHIVGDRWPAAGERQAMLEEAIEVIRLLWEGGQRRHRGQHYTVVDAQVYTLPQEPPPILVAASGKKAARMAGRMGDGLIGLAPDADLVSAFDQSGGQGKPRYAEVTVCWADDEATARFTALDRWPNAAIPGELVAELPAPRHFAQAAQLVTEDVIAEKVVCGPDPERHLEMIGRYADAGYDHVWIHQVGPHQEGSSVSTGTRSFPSSANTGRRSQPANPDPQGGARGSGDARSGAGLYQ
jgi:G6PDH family F420-dependent oxidoreductase